ncbi:MAG: branched-chain amino acid ABC transporter permease [Streptosporangiales bacterium]|nr:branched-chain amino acid ABC transporter permease [Streptosporangiales bacterium]
MSALLQYVISGLALGCTFALVGSGFVVIHRVTRVVNFAQGAFPVIAGLATASLLTRGLPHGAAELVAILLGGVIGLVVGVVAIGKPGTPPLASLVITLGLAIFAYAVEIIVWGDQPVSFPGLSGTVNVAGARIQQQYFLVIVVALVTFALLELFFGRTYLGKGLAACASNPYSARLVGISVTRMGLVAFALGGVLGGLAGVLVTPLQAVSFDSDVTLAINGFAAAIFGGLMRPMMALVGGLVLGVAEALVAGYYESAFQTEVALAIMLTLMVWQASRRSALEEA